MRFVHRYLEGACHFHAHAHDKAAASFANIPAVARRSGPMGRPIPVEAFALRRATAYMAAAASGVDVEDRLSVPGLELLYFWNGFSQCEQSQLDAVEEVSV